ncbi:MAG: hypothetical protein WBF99_17645 [Xanthobacteraceae bacterium]
MSLLDMGSRPPMGVWHEINVSCIVEHYLFYEINEIYEILFGRYGDAGPGLPWCGRTALERA